MAADLVESSTTLQTLKHDLESFFWVLLWIVLMQVPCSWGLGRRSRFINETMDPRLYGQDQDGGNAKKMFLTHKDSLRKEEFDIPNNTVLHGLLKSLKKIVAARHRLPPDNPNEEAESSYKQGLTYLEDHKKMLKEFRKSLESEWPTKDPAEYQRITVSKSTLAAGQCSSKRSRSTAELDGISLEPSSSKRRG